jgi:hypothetical protein
MSLVLSGTDGVSDIDGSAATPAIRGTDTNTGIFFPAADTIAFAEGGVESMRLDSASNMGIGTSSPAARLQVTKNAADVARFTNSLSNGGDWEFKIGGGGFEDRKLMITDKFGGADNVRLAVDSSGNLLVGKTAFDNNAGFAAQPSGNTYIVRSGGTPLAVNRLVNDGALVEFYQDSTQEGTISVSGTTVSYNGGHLSRWAQTTDPKDETLLKGTVLSNLDEMNVYTDADGNPAQNEQLNKVKVSDVEGDANVAGVFVNWTHDDAHNVDEINMAMTGDMIIRIAQGVTVQRGDLLMSAGDGTAKPQGDDIVRSKTVAKVTSTHVTCTYADGSYCVPCVLMAC